MVDSRVWITGREASVIWKLAEEDMLSRLQEGRDWVQMRRYKQVRVSSLCRMYGRGPWQRWGGSGH